MSERKVFFPGLGGNRYEVSLEELREMAYKGKIKREDELVLWEKKGDGKATEIRTTCGKVKGLEEIFAQGEADRVVAKAERAQRKAEEMQARKAQEEADYAEKLQRQAEESARKEQQREYAKYVAGETALARVKTLIRAIAFWPAVVLVSFSALYLLCLPLIYLCRNVLGDSLVGGAFTILPFILIFDVIVCAVCFFYYWLSMLPVWLVEYHAETIKRAILDAARIQADGKVADEAPAFAKPEPAIPVPAAAPKSQSGNSPF